VAHWISVAFLPWRPQSVNGAGPLPGYSCQPGTIAGQAGVMQ
jgi:hypothetical protein